MASPSLSTRRRTGVATLLPQGFPALAGLLSAALAHRVFSGLAREGAADVIARALPARAAALVAGAAARPLLPAACLGAAPIVAWLLAAAWASRVPGVSFARARRAVGWAWTAGALAAAIALLARISDPKPGFAALGYALAWPALASLAVALVVRRSGALVFASVLSAAALVILGLRLLPLGWPGQASWTWWPMWPARPAAEWGAGVAWIAGGWLLMLALSRLESRAPRRWALAGLALVSLCFARGLPHLEHYGPEKHPAALASEINTSFFQMTPRLANAGAFLRTFPDSTRVFPMHGATHPPGWPLLFRGAVEAGGTAAGGALARGVARTLGADEAASAALASDVAHRPLAPAETNGLWLLVGLMTLGLAAVPAATYFAARAHEAPRVAFRAAGLAAVLGAPLLFFPDVDVVYPALALVAAGAWLRSERKGREIWALLAGACLAALAALSYGNLALVLVLGLQAGLSARRRPVTFGLELRRAAWLLGPLVALDIMAAAAGHDAFASLDAALRHHRDTLVHRSGLLWTLLNPLDLVVLAGIPIAAWLGRATPWWHHPGAAQRLRMDPESALFGGTLLALVLLDLSGTTKGEAGRLWMPFMPLLVAGGAALWRERKRAEWACITGLALGTLAVLKGFYAFVWLY